MGSLGTYVARRILFAIPVFLAVSIVTFLAITAVGNPADLVRAGLHNPTAAQIAAIRAYFHADDPVWTRYFFWLADFLQGNLGRSLYSGTVAGNVGPWVLTTLELQIPALLLSLAIGIPVGVYSAKHQYSKSDMVVTTTAIFGVSTPTFWLGILLIIIVSGQFH